MISWDELHYRLHAPNSGLISASWAVLLRTGLTFIPIGVAIGYGAFLLQGYWWTGLLWFVSVVLIVSGCISLCQATLGSVLWYLLTTAYRRRCRMLLAERGWPRVWLSPSLTAFSIRVWDRLPEYGAFAASPVADHGQGIYPLQLYAALCLADAALNAAPPAEDYVETAVTKILTHRIEAKCTRHSKQ